MRHFMRILSELGKQSKPDTSRGKGQKEKKVVPKKDKNISGWGGH